MIFCLILKPTGPALANVILVKKLERALTICIDNNKLKGQD